MNKNKEFVYLILMTFFRYLGDCFFYGYLFLFLKSKGLTESNIGLITCITPLVAIVVNPLWNHLAKDVNKNRILMIFITITEGIMIFSFTRCNVFESFVICTILLAMIATPYYNLSDGFNGTFAKVYNKKYAFIRSAGTIGYFVGSLIAALVLYLSNDNYNILLYMSSILFVLTSLWFIVIKPIDLKLVDKKENKRNYKEVLTNKTFWMFLFLDLIVIQISSVSDSYVSTYFTTYQNISSTNWSIIYSSILITEFILMLFTTKFKKINPNIAITLVGFSYLLRSLVFALDLPLPFIIIASLLRGVSYGLYLPYLIQAVEKICGLKNITCACFILAVATSILKSISLFTYGNLIDLVGYPKFYLIVFFIVLFGVIINLIYQIKIKFKYPEFKKEVNL